MHQDILNYTESLTLFCQGDNKALALLYNQWVPEFYLIAYRYTQNEQEAEDVVADCFEKLIKMSVVQRTQKFIEEAVQLKALLLVMVKNKSLDVVKVRQNRKRIVDGIKHLFPTIGYSTSRQTLTDENFAVLLSCLPEKESLILGLHIEGYSLTEISVKVGVAEKTVSNILALARNKVRELWVVFME